MSSLRWLLGGEVATALTSGGPRRPAAPVGRPLPPAVAVALPTAAASCCSCSCVRNCCSTSWFCSAGFWGTAVQWETVTEEACALLSRGHALLALRGTRQIGEHSSKLNVEHVHVPGGDVRVVR